MLPLDPITLTAVVIAAIVGFKLWSVLGQRTGEEKQWREPAKLQPRTIENEPKPQPEKPAGQSWANHAEPDSALFQNIAQLTKRDRSFDPDHFLSGAAKAFEMINQAFAKGDNKTLAPLLSKDLMKEFAADIDLRRGKGETMAWQLVKIESCRLKDAVLNGNAARLTVHFVSSAISSIADKNGAIVAGHATAIEKSEDFWSFERTINASDPNWKLVATSEP